MAHFAMVLAPQGIQEHHRQLHQELEQRLDTQLDGLSSEDMVSRRHLACKMWLPHSRSQGFGKDDATGSWLACIGNPLSRGCHNVPPGQFAGHLLKRLLDDGECAVTELNAPFAIVVHDGRNGQTHVVSDRGGFQCLYIARVDDAHVLCSSSLVLAATTGVHLDADAVATYFQTGYLFGDMTLYREIRRVSAATWLSFLSDQVRRKRYWHPPGADASRGNVRDWAEEIVDAGVEHVGLALECGEPTAVELTSGLDSRFALACAQRTGRPFVAWTIADINSKDLTTAQTLAQVCSVKHVAVSPLQDLSETFDLDFRQLHALTDGEIDCLNVIASPSANRQSARIRRQSVSGGGGEMLRGFHYGLPRLWPTDAHLLRLVSWRVGVRMNYDLPLFRPAFADPEKKRLRSVLAPILRESSGHPARWRLDHFHLYGSMQGAGGRSMTFNNLFYRPITPYCSNRMLDVCFSMPPRFKSRGLALRHAMALCAPKLSRVPLGTGLPPRPWGPSDVPVLARSYGSYLG